MTATSTISLDSSRLQHALNTLATAMDQRPPATAAVLVVATSSQLLCRETFAAKSFQHQLTPDSLFLLVSITKPIIATAIMQLVDDGLLTLHQPITYYLPDFDRPDKAPVTTWHLLTHTSGIGEIDWPTTLRHYPQYAVSYEVACAYPLDFWPGTQFQYSTLAFYVLSELITRLSGMPYQAYLQQRLFAPLAMHHTTFDPRPTFADRMVPVEGITAGIPISSEKATNRFIAMANPGAGLWSSAPDLIRFGQALLKIATSQEQNPYILSNAALTLMTREHMTGLTKMENKHTQHVHYSLGWRKGSLGTYILPGSPLVFEHDGATGGQLWIDPEWDLVFVFLTNTFGADATLRYGALQTIYSALSRG